jgi:two-component system, sensor histidine kinase
MIKLSSLKAKTIAFTVLIVLVPLIIIGIAGTMYYGEIIKHSVQDNFIEDARIVAQLTSNYLDRALFYIEGQTDASPLINAVARQNRTALDDYLARITDATDIYYWTYVTDSGGTIIASHPYGSMVGVNISDYPVFTEPMQSGGTYVSSPIPVSVSDRPSVILATPIRENGTIIGVLCGALDNYHYMDLLNRAMVSMPSETRYIVNRTGHIFVHDDRGIMWHVDDFSDRPVVQSVLRGEEGVREYVDPARGDVWVGGFAPVRKYGLGVIMAEPADLAYKPVRDAALAFLATLAALTILLIGAALLVGNYLTRPIVHMSKAAQKVSKTGNVLDLSKYLPYDRDDELGSLARAFKDMADNIMDAREKIMGEKKHADMYIDVMGHDINNLNQAILSRLEIIKGSGQLNPQQRECLEGAIAATRESAATIRNVKAIQAVTTEKPVMQEADLDGILRECIGEAPRPEGKKVAINYLPGKGLIVEAVPGIRLAFCNVIKNAIKYSGAEVTIEIDVKKETKDGKKCHVTTIADDGNGIPEETKETLFTRFQQGSTVPPGKGLGLYAAKVLVEQSGGSIGIENRIPEDYKKGTRLIISLPAAGAPGE